MSSAVIGHGQLRYLLISITSENLTVQFRTFRAKMQRTSDDIDDGTHDAGCTTLLWQNPQEQQLKGFVVRNLARL
jgi:hypothetical protein